MEKIEESWLDMVKNQVGRSYCSQEISSSPNDTAAIGWSDRGVALKRSQAATYDEKLAVAKKWWFVFYDTDDVRGWFLDGPSALLHLVRLSLAMYQNDLDTVGQYVFRLHENSSGGNQSYGVLKNPDNRRQKLRTGFTEVFEDKVEKIWSKLDWVISKQEILNREFPDNFGQIQGFQFVDIADDALGIRLCEAELEPAKSTWLNLTRIQSSNTAILFGRGFGDLIKPTESALDSLCPFWQALPKGEGYLAARVQDIENSLRGKRYYGKTWRIGNEQKWCHWFAPSDSFSTTLHHGTGDSQCCERAHIILPEEVLKEKKGTPITSPQEPLPTHGAIIFGLSTHCPSYWEKTPPSEDPDAEAILSHPSATSCPSDSSFGLTTSSSYLDAEPSPPLSRQIPTRSRKSNDIGNGIMVPQLHSLVHPKEAKVASTGGPVIRQKKAGLALLPGPQEATEMSSSHERPKPTMQRLLELFTGAESVVVHLLTFCARILTALVCMVGSCSALASGDSFCARVRFFSCCMLWANHCALSSVGWRFRSALLSLTLSGTFVFLLSWCIILTPLQILFTTPLELWKMPPNYTFVSHHIVYQPPSRGGIDAEYVFRNPHLIN